MIYWPIGPICLKDLSDLKDFRALSNLNDIKGGRCQSIFRFFVHARK